MFNFNKLLPNKERTVSEGEAKPEAFKNLDYLLRTGYNARVIEMEGGAAYEIKSDISKTNWFDEVAQDSELTVTSEEQTDGTFLVTVLINQLETT